MYQRLDSGGVKVRWCESHCFPAILRKSYSWHQFDKYNFGMSLCCLCLFRLPFQFFTSQMYYWIIRASLTHHLVQINQVQLVALAVSRVSWQQRAYLQGLQNLLDIAEDQARFLIASRPGEIGFTSLLSIQLIPFDVI